MGNNFLFRGSKFPIKGAKVGKKYRWTHFTSTSIDIEEAKKFSGKDGVIFEIHLLEGEERWVSIDIGRLTQM